MAKGRDPLRDKAFEIYKNNNGSIKVADIAKALNVESTKISSWKSIDRWDLELGFKRRRRGAQKGNTNAIGNTGGAVKGNYNAFKHGNYTSEERLAKNLEKHLPKAIANIIKESLEENPIDKLWKSILVLEANIFGVQKIIHAKNKKDITKVLKKSSWGKTESEEYEILLAEEKASKSLLANSVAMKTLAGMIKQYDEMIHKDWDLVTEEQKARIEVLKSKIVTTENKDEKLQDYIDKLSEGIKEL